MIIGSGNIAQSLKDFDRPDVTFFASGTSDSSMKDDAKFQREASLLMKQDKEKHIVYFSSLGIYRFDTPYLRHKRRMEKLVKRFFLSYTIIRLEVIEWGKNPTTILNVMRQTITSDEYYDIRDEYRHVLSLDEFRYWMKMILVGECNEMNLPGTRLHVKEMYQMVKDGKL